MHVLGIDVGGSGIKGAVVDIATGTLVTEKLRLPTPDGARPDDIAMVVKEIVGQLNWSGKIGIGFPSLIINGVALIAANIDSSWVGLNVVELFSNATGCPVVVVNDADAAGIAEMTYGTGKAYQKGVVLFLTLGTGIGSAFFVNGHLFPNTELGHLEVRGKDAEKRASAAVRTEKNLGWKEWAERLQEVLAKMEMLFSPDVIILGGGVSKNSDKFLPYLNLRAKVIPAQLRNDAGIIGAALFASRQG
ncbi:MAG: ROK family protein [Anaerolineae bacterium]|nr:ROK family protein [Anaerolineae bacterium]